ncbi:MAG: acetate--CoA ligase family protein, partial [Chloroflexi bacterium]|nr:acetate--CoA ligase family protein [Chloroflexota bacterium]
MPLVPAVPKFDPVHDILHYESRALDSIFAPRNVALLGASENPGSVGRTLLWNLISNPFGGAVFPVNPKRSNVLGIKAYPNMASVPERVDLAVIATPAPSVPGLISECVDAGVKGAIVISAGFKETGKAGVELEHQIMEHARRGNMRIIGPNCLGVMSPVSGLNSTFASTMVRKGKVGFISQSGALCTAVLDWSLQENVGFSAFVSIGSILDVGWGDLIYYLGDDPNTESIVIYMETIGDARAFLSAAREVALTKPIIVIKPGRTAGAAKAAASHTGSLTGSDEVLEIAFRRSGVLRVNSIAELFYMANVLSKQPRPNGHRLTILTNAGGPGVLATDALITGGGELTELSPETMQAYNDLLPAAWSHNNPVDIMASWMGGSDVEKGDTILSQSNIPTFPYPDTAARMFDYMAQYSDNLRALYETPSLPGVQEKHTDSSAAAAILERARQSGRTILTEYESKQLLASYGIPTVETRIAASEDEAARIAAEIGFPVVLKLHSETITHKTDVGGVQLNLGDAEAVRRAFRMIRDSVAKK